MFAIIWKDLVLEARRRETVVSLFVLGVLMLVVFNFAIEITPANVGELAPGMLWVAVVFSATLGLSRTFLVERENGAMTALLLAPIDRGSLYLAKFTVNLILMLVFEALLLPVFLLFFGYGIGMETLHLAAVLTAGTIGLAATGTLFALAALGTRAREMMLPLIVLPLQIPLVIAAVRATHMVLSGQPIWELGSWGTILVAFDVLFVTLGWLAFEFVTVD